MPKRIEQKRDAAFWHYPESFFLIFLISSNEFMARRLGQELPLV